VIPHQRCRVVTVSSASIIAAADAKRCTGSIDQRGRDHDTEREHRSDGLM
jgi:hypothetical protein